MSENENNNQEEQDIIKIKGRIRSIKRIKINITHFNVNIYVKSIKNRLSL